MKQFLGILAGLALPVVASAHVKWFVDETAVEPTEHFSLGEPWVLAWLGAIVLAIVVGTVLDVRLPNVSERWKLRLRSWQPRVVILVRLLVGTWLLVNVYFQTVLVPSYPVDDAFTRVLHIMEFITGGLLITGVLLPLGSILLLVLYVGASIAFGWVSTLEHVFLVGIAFYLFLYTYKGSPFSTEWAAPLLRVFTSVSLVVLGLQEKLLHPELALAFLKDHANFNFMQVVGVTAFSDRLFVLSAGMTEVLFGLIFLLGIVTRINTAALALFFVSTAFMLGIHEVTGHLPLFAVVVVLLLYGSGPYLKFSNLFRKKDDTIV